MRTIATAFSTELAEHDTGTMAEGPAMPPGLRQSNFSEAPVRAPPVTLTSLLLSSLPVKYTVCIRCIFYREESLCVVGKPTSSVLPDYPWVELRIQR